MCSASDWWQNSNQNAEIFLVEDPNELVKGQNFIQAQRVCNVAYLQQWAVHVHGTNLCQYTSFIFFSMALQVDPDKVFHLLCQATMISPLLMHRLTSHFEHSMDV